MNNLLDPRCVRVIRPGSAEVVVNLRRAGARRIGHGQAVTIQPGHPDIPARWVMYELAGERFAVIFDLDAQPDSPETTTLDVRQAVGYTVTKLPE